MSEAPVQPDKSRHVVDAMPVEARPFQGQRAGVVTRTAANAVDFTVAVLVVAAGYLAWSATLFVIDAQGFSFPKPSFLLLLACGELVLFTYFTACLGDDRAHVRQPPDGPAGRQPPRRADALGRRRRTGSVLPRLPDRSVLGGRQHEQQVAAGHRAPDLGDLRLDHPAAGGALARGAPATG